MLELNCTERGPLSHWRALTLCVAGITAVPKSGTDKDLCTEKEALPYFTVRTRSVCTV